MTFKNYSFTKVFRARMKCRKKQARPKFLYRSWINKWSRQPIWSAPINDPYITKKHPQLSSVQIRTLCDKSVTTNTVNCYRLVDCCQILFEFDSHWKQTPSWTLTKMEKNEIIFCVKKTTTDTKKRLNKIKKYFGDCAPSVEVWKWFAELRCDRTSKGVAEEIVSCL